MVNLCVIRILGIAIHKLREGADSESFRLAQSVHAVLQCCPEVEETDLINAIGLLQARITTGQIPLGPWHLLKILCCRVAIRISEPVQAIVSNHQNFRQYATAMLKPGSLRSQTRTED